MSTNPVREWARRLALLLSVAWFVQANVLQGGQLFWHQVRLDPEGKLLSWVDTESPYDSIIRNDWEMFKSIPVQSEWLPDLFYLPGVQRTQ